MPLVQVTSVTASYHFVVWHFHLLQASWCVLLVCIPAPSPSARLAFASWSATHAWGRRFLELPWWASYMCLAACGAQLLVVTTAREILEWMLPSEPPKSLRASECALVKNA